MDTSHRDRGERAPLRPSFLERNSTPKGGKAGITRLAVISLSLRPAIDIGRTRNYKREKQSSPLRFCGRTALLTCRGRSGCDKCGTPTCGPGQVQRLFGQRGRAAAEKTSEATPYYLGSTMYSP
jgi:hypothetical protein